MAEKKKEAVTVKEESKKCLNTLVTESEEKDILIIGALSKNGLLPEYYKEQKDSKLGLTIQPKMTTEEFTKMINDYKKMEV
jgi:hypothetical protein